jgi:alkylation response protein AidB-like acyl-CoA dehydrogenase
MDLRPDESQADFISTVAGFARSAAAANVAETEVLGDYGPQVTMTELAGLGLPGLTLPEAVGGSDATLLDLCLALEQLGAGGITTPLIPSTVIVGGILSEVLAELPPGDPAADRITAVLSGLADGTAVAAPALLGARTTSEWDWYAPTASRSGEGWTLTAEHSQVPYVHLAEWLLLVAELPDRGESLVLLHLPDLPDGAFSHRPQRVIGGPSRGASALHDVAVAPDAVLPVAPERVRELLTRALTRASVAATAHTVGAAEGALALAVDWAGQRQQFGRIIGSFQTVSSRCADMRLAIDPSRLLNWEAAWSLDEERPDADERVAVAKSYLAVACPALATHAHQVMGAIGYSVEHRMHIHTRLLKAYQNSYGASTLHLERVAQAIGL